MAPASLRTAADDCADAVVSTFGTVFATIDSWRSALEGALPAPVTAAQVDSLTEALVVPSLSAAGAMVIGAGFVAAPGFLSDTRWHLAWWLGHANTFGVVGAAGIRRLEAEEDESSEEFRDYTTLEWWRVPARDGSRHITGPYVDYLCTDDYTLTLTMPVVVDRTMVGVVGADLYVNDIERALLPRVRAIDGTATLVNAAGRVVVSTDPHRATGSLLRDAAASASRLACGDTGLTIVHAG
jgi:hypothetical protein